MSKDVLMKISAILAVVVLLTALGWLWVGDVLDDGNGDGPGDGSPYGVPPVGSGLSTPFYVVFDDPEFQADPLDYELPLGEGDVVEFQDFVDRMDLTDDQVAFLLANGMVGIGEDGQGFVSFGAAYEYIQKDNGFPVFITSDSVLDAYHHIFEGVLIELETTSLTDMAKIMAHRLMWDSHAQVDELPAGQKDLARMNVVYFGVALRIFDPSAQVPDYAEEDVGRIIEKINDAKGIMNIPGFHQKEDFTQYKPRGHYTRSKELTRYFKGMMWFGRITFQGKYEDEARRAVLIASALEGDETAWKAYTSFANVIDFMVGQPDDLTPHEVMEVAEDVMGPLNGTYDALLDDAKLAELMHELSKLRKPKINSDVVFPGEDVWGMRVFGQRYVPDSYIFQELVFNKVPDRDMPTCLDVFAVMGSEEAWAREDWDRYGPVFDSQMEALKEEFASYPESEWTETLYTSWLHSLKSIHEPTPEPAGPGFMQTRAWSAKELNAQAASWTQLTHDTILYRKQSYTFLRGMPTLSDTVYVEPVPVLYSRLADMVDATMRGLEELGFSSYHALAKLETYSITLKTLERVAVAEMEGKDPRSEDVSSLRHYYSTIGGLNEMAEGEDTKTILVSDVHTDPNAGEVLQEGVGPVRLMVVVVPTKGGNVATVGGVFEHYEFTQPMDGRLSDEEWTAMLEDGTAPEPAPWAQDFIV